MRLEFHRIERCHLGRPAWADLLKVAVAGHAVLRQGVNPRPRLRMMRLPGQSGGHAGRQQQRISQLVQRGIGFEAEARGGLPR